MEAKMGSATSQDVNVASQQHYNAENEIMAHVKNMTLAGKKALANKMADHAAEAENDAKSK